jgi:signal transduction histidine kinase
MTYFPILENRERNRKGIQMITMTPTIPDERLSSMSPRKMSSFLEPPGIRERTDLAGFATVRPKQTAASNRKHAQKLIEATEDVRRHIARELHDDIGQRLSLLSIRLGSLQQLHVVDDPDNNLEESLRDLGILISDVHHLSHSLHSSRIEHLGLDAALREIFGRILKSYGTHIDFFVENVPRRLGPGFALCFFRIAQEAVNNAIRHGGASRIEVVLAVRDDILTMRVRDFGIGFDRNLVQQGLGLMAMEERMAAIGGTLTVESEQGAGTMITAAADLLSLSDGLSD